MFPPFALLRQVLSGVILLTNQCSPGNSSLVAEGMVIDLLALQEEEHLELSMMWNRTRKFHRGLEAL